MHFLVWAQKIWRKKILYLVKIMFFSYVSENRARILSPKNAFLLIWERQRSGVKIKKFQEEIFESQKRTF